jgi:hypothetical protein
MRGEERLASAFLNQIERKYLSDGILKEASSNRRILTAR